jgi:hypothetical protein
LLKEIQTRKEDLIIFWLGMPPMMKEGKDNEKLFEWPSYPKKSILIREAVMKYNQEMVEIDKKSQQARHGTLVPRMYFIDLESFGKERKLYEYQNQGLYAVDHLHWVNHGPFSVPAYILEVIFHLYIRYRLISQNLVVEPG